MSTSRFCNGRARTWLLFYFFYFYFLFFCSLSFHSSALLLSRGEPPATQRDKGERRKSARKWCSDGKTWSENGERTSLEFSFALNKLYRVSPDRLPVLFRFLWVPGRSTCATMEKRMNNAEHWLDTLTETNRRETSRIDVPGNHDYVATCN